MHAAIKGPSAAGKSEIRKRVLEFFPREAVLSFTMLSEKALLYFEQDFCHMILSMGEAAGSEEQQIQDYLLRELMSDGKLRYPVTVKIKDGLATHIIEKNGPVCFLVTTTKHALHHENETRMLSIEVDDSADQTSAVLLKIAETEGLNNKIRSEQYVQWQNFQRWLALGNCRVVVPYASVLAKLVQPKSVRLRRDFTQMLMAIKAHVLLHREHRFTDDDGELSANMSDYAAVQELMSDLMAETSETKIKPSVQETVDALRTLQAKVGSEGVTVTAVGKALRLDKSSALRRLRGAVDVGLVKNMETRKGWPGLYRTADVDLDTQELLPTVEELIDHGARMLKMQHNPLPLQPLQPCNRRPLYISIQWLSCCKNGCTPTCNRCTCIRERLQTALQPFLQPLSHCFTITKGYRLHGCTGCKGLQTHPPFVARMITT